MVPDNEDDDREPPYSSTVTVEDYEAEEASSSSEKPDLGKIKADGEEVPEAYRGKSVTEIIQIAETARGAMNQSVEAARNAAEAARAAAEAGGRREAPVVEEPKEMTREELKALYDEDPIAAIDKMQEQALRRAEMHVEARLGAITEGTVSQAENWARQEFKDEFEIFGDEIMKMVGGIKNKAVFTSKQGWEDAVSYVRGKKGNFEKLVEHRAAKQNEENGNNARKNERERAGFTGRSVSGNTRSREVSNEVATRGMSDEERTIAQRFIDNGTFKDMAEYKRWQRMGG